MQIPEKHLQVNGFRHIGSNEYYVEWRKTMSNQIINVWASFGERGPNVWDVLYTVRDRNNNSILDQGDIAKIPGGSGSEKKAIEAAVRFMESYQQSSYNNNTSISL